MPEDVLQSMELLKTDLAQGESQEVEFKQEFPSNTTELAAEIAAFATSNPGRIYVGVTDDKQVIGLNVSKDDFQNRVGGLVRDSVKPSIIVPIEFLAVGDKIIARLSVPKGLEPVYLVNNIPYYRNLTRKDHADSSILKELHRKYFLGTTTIERTEEKKAIIAIMNQISDYEIMWSDHADRPVNPDLNQLRYDIRVTGESLEESGLKIDEESLRDEIANLGQELVKIANKQFYIDGGKSWREYREEGDKALTVAEQLKNRILKRLSLSLVDEEDIRKQIELNLRQLSYVIKMVETSSKEPTSLRDDFRRLAYNFSRFSNLIKMSSTPEPHEGLYALALSLRQASQTRVSGLDPQHTLKQSLPSIKEHLSKI